MGYQRGLSADETVGSPVLQQQIDKIDQNTADIIERLKVEKRARTIGTWVTIAGALFAAIRLGIVTVPKLLSRRAPRLMGEIEGHPVANPRRRRRARR